MIWGRVKIERLQRKVEGELVPKELLGSRKAGTMWTCFVGSGEMFCKLRLGVGKWIMRLFKVEPKAFMGHQRNMFCLLTSWKALETRISVKIHWKFRSHLCALTSVEIFCFNKIQSDYDSLIGVKYKHLKICYLICFWIIVDAYFP